MNKSSNTLLPDSLPAADILKMLWTNWAIGFGSLMLLLLLSLWLPYLWLPVIAAGAALYIRQARIPACHATADGALTAPVLAIACRSLWCSAAIMLAIEILCTPFLIGRVILLPMYNDEIPFITCLIVFPVLALQCAWQLIFGRNRRRPEALSPAGAIRAMLPRETTYQVQILLLLSLLLGGVEAWYYFARYINSNLNDPDRFFFVIMPLGFYLLSLFFMGGRYTTLSSLVEAVDTMPSAPLSTLVRYLIFSDNEILIRPNHFGLYDSPAESIRQGTDPVNEATARELFAKMADTQAFTLRYLYSSDSLPSNLKVLHYAAILDADLDRREIAPEDGDGAGDRWAGFYDIRRLAAEGRISPVLASELVRIYSVTMAWKTYDRNGRRQYPIRNYKPTFRFRDLAKWDVDYDDPLWREIAEFNEDKPLYRIRKFFRRK